MNKELVELGALAKAYTKALVEYHVADRLCRNRGLPEDVAAVAKATSAMYSAQNDLNAACVALAAMAS